MYISLNWIKDYVDLSGVDLKELINQFTLSCAEVEGVEEKGKNLSGVVTGKIESIQNHPNSTKLHLLKVNVGNTVIDVVCGAPNVREGMIVPVALVGANVNGLIIESAKVAGYESNGMCCSAKEIGISLDHSGLFEFPKDTIVGEDIKKILDIEDVIFEVDNKSLTNRPDMWGHYGIAREISVLIKRNLKPLPIADIKNDKPNVKVDVASGDCYRYCSSVISNISQKVSPINMQIRLFYCGMRSINLLTDITNYIMLELGQPMHAFDNDIVKSISVENINNDTKFITLDEAERVLPKNTMVIKSNNNIVAIAGVMGGLDSAISDTTESVLIESANFNAYSVRTTAIKLGLRTESSARYEKSLDPELTIIALKRYAYLMEKIDENCAITCGITDVYNYKYPEISINITKEYIDRYVGIDIPSSTIVDILSRLQFKVLSVSEGEYQVSVPSFRATKDVSCKADLVEEITRIYGYGNIVAKSCKQSVAPVQPNRAVEMEYATKYVLATRYNLSEVHSYIWYDSSVSKQLAIEPKSVIKVVNSIQKDNNQIRSTMLPSQLKSVIENQKDYSNFGIFEVGRVVKELNKNNLVNEEKSLAITMYSEDNRESNLVKLKDILLYLAEYVFNVKISFVRSNPKINYISPANYYEVMIDNNVIGEIGYIHPNIERKINNKSAICFTEINFDKLIQSNPQSVKFAAVSKFPISEMDFTFIIPTNVEYNQIEKIAKSVKCDILYEVNLLDIYEISSEKKSYTIHYKLWKFDRTLNSEELEQFHENVIKKFGENDINMA